MTQQVKMTIDDVDFGTMHRQSVQKTIISAHTWATKINGKNMSNLNLMSLDALCDLFIGAMEMCGINGKNRSLYKTIVDSREKFKKMYSQNKVADSICADNEKSTFAYTIANTQRTANRSKMREFRNMLIKMAWNSKIQ